MKLKEKITVCLITLSLLVCSLCVFAVALTEGEMTDAERAERFILAVDSIEDVANIEERYGNIEIAYSAPIYFDDVSYEGVGEALEKLAFLKQETEATIGACEDFIVAVDELVSIYDLGYYALTREALDKVEGIEPDIDYTYSGVSSAKASYDSIKTEIEKGERYMTDFLAEVDRIDGCTTYAERKTLGDSIDSYVNGSLFIEDFPGVEEALAEVDGLERLINEALRDAALFKLAAEDAAAAAPNEFKGKLIACFAHLEKVDMTAEDAISGKRTFDGLLEKYESTAAIMNEIMRG